jgi:MoaA/NifB/PqqE/SkfB family radical SAM enzyme
MKIKRRMVWFLTRFAEFQFLRDLYIWWMYFENWWFYGDSLFPRMMSIEISTHCNRSCHYCPNLVAPSKPRLIKDEVFDQIVDRIAEIKYRGVVDFIFFNEPTLHPRLPELVARLKKKVPHCIPRICTNGDLLTVERTQSLLDAGLDRIYVMRHVPTPEGWRENIDMLANKFKGVYVKMDIEKIEETIGLNNFGGLVEVKKLLKPLHTRSGEPSCTVHNHVAQFTIDGDWDLCCTDYAKTHQFGSLLKRPIMDIWHDPEFVRMRGHLRNGRPQLPVCKDCFVFADGKIA